MKELIIIPDVHGRIFWKEAVKDLQPNQKVIFLGDEHDPYPAEGISLEDSINNLKEIIQFKKEHMDQVVLLWGNHAYHYLDNILNGSRKDFQNLNEVCKLYEDNKDLYKFFHIEEREDGTTLLFSHAGVHLEWISDAPNKINDKESFIKLLEETNFTVYNLWKVSIYRGGDCYKSSCIWADLREWLRKPYYFGYEEQEYEGNRYEVELKHTLYEVPAYKGLYQIFGHTQLQNYYKNDNIACLDCRRAFKYTDVLRELDGTELKNTEQ